MIDRDSSLVDVAFEVCSALDKIGIVAVLTGGSAAMFYSDRYRSRDADFVIIFGIAKAAVETLTQLGFRQAGSHYEHQLSTYTLDFPPGPLGVGSENITSWDTVRRGSLILHVITRTDSVRDRLAAFFHWSDLGSLETALSVARSGPIDLDLIERWSKTENAVAKFEEFSRRLSRRAER